MFFKAQAVGALLSHLRDDYALIRTLKASDADVYLFPQPSLPHDGVSFSSSMPASSISKLLALTEGTEATASSFSSS